MDSRSPSRAPRVLILPGWENSGEGHWQTLWEQSGVGVRVQQDDWHWPRRGDWMARLDEVLLAEPDRPAVLVAHSLGCQLVAAWAAHSRHTHLVRAALLVAPPDTERLDMPPQLHGWRPIVRRSLPFPSLVVLSTDDPYCDPGRAAELAHDWGSRQTVIIGDRGHINAESGLADWPEGRAMLTTLLSMASL